MADLWVQDRINKFLATNILVVNVKNIIDASLGKLFVLESIPFCLQVVPVEQFSSLKSIGQIHVIQKYGTIVLYFAWHGLWGRMSRLQDDSVSMSPDACWWVVSLRPSTIMHSKAVERTIRNLHSDIRQLSPSLLHHRIQKNWIPLKIGSARAKGSYGNRHEAIQWSIKNNHRPLKYWDRRMHYCRLKVLCYGWCNTWMILGTWLGT